MYAGVRDVPEGTRQTVDQLLNQARSFVDLFLKINLQSWRNQAKHLGISGGCELGSRWNCTTKVGRKA